MKRQIPKRVAGVRVEESGEPMNLRGLTWHTLIPVDEGDTRVWEWAEESGRIIQTQR